jgi:hypothetical protein
MCTARSVMVCAKITSHALVNARPTLVHVLHMRDDLAVAFTSKVRLIFLQDMSCLY